MNADRYYFNEKIKIKRDIVLIIQRAKEYDYSFIARLLGEVFGSESLKKSSIGTLNAERIAYANLDLEKYNSVKGTYVLVRAWFKIGSLMEISYFRCLPD